MAKRLSALVPSGVDKAFAAEVPERLVWIVYLRSKASLQHTALARL
jgi:hypothetical protein